MTVIAIVQDLSPVPVHPDPDRHARLEQLGDRITELTAHLDAGMYRLLVLIERFDREGGWHGDGVRSCAHWLGWRCGLALGAARERVRVARALPALPKISAAFAGGRVSYSKVWAMTRVATPENEDELLNIAIHGTAFHVERLVRVYRRLKRFEALEAEQLRHFRREVHCYQDDDGAFVLRARLTPEQGALLSKALAQAQDRLFEEQRNEPEDVSAATPQAPLDQEIPEASAWRRRPLHRQYSHRYRYLEIKWGRRRGSVGRSRPRFRGNVAANGMRCRSSAVAEWRDGRTAEHRPQVTDSPVGDPAGIETKRQGLPVPGVHLHPIRGCPSYSPLGRWRRDRAE